MTRKSSSCRPKLNIGDRLSGLVMASRVVVRPGWDALDALDGY